MNTENIHGLQEIPDVWPRHYTTSAGFRWWPCEELVRVIGDRTFETAVEIGCGNGANLWFLAEHARRVIGIDSNGEAVTAAQSYMRHRGVQHVVQIRHQDILAGPPLQVGEADLLVDAMLSQHIPWDLHPQLYQIYWAMLRPGGTLICYNLGPGTEAARLFPASPPSCLASWQERSEALRLVGFRIQLVRQTTRRYEMGAEARYVLVEARR